MKEISVFDVIGPNMIGPSSSHTAGALRIALMAGKIASGKPKDVTFILYGSFARTYKGHGTDRALVAGILGFGTEDYRIRDSFQYAQEAGITFRFQPDFEETRYHPNTVEVIITNEEGITTSVVGVSVGGGQVKLKQINGVEISLSGNYHTLFIQQNDVPGVVAYITKCLSEQGINIAFMRLYRENRGEKAYTIVETDEIIRPEVVELVRSHPNITSAMLIEL